MAKNLASEVSVTEEQPTVRTLPTTAALRLAGLGVTERGPIGEVKGPFTSFTEWQRVFGGYTANSLDSTAAVAGFFGEAGENNGGQLYWSRVVHMTVNGDPTTKTSAAGTLALDSASSSPTQGSVTSAVGPFALAHGDTLVVSIDGGGNQTFTVNATAPARTTANAEPFALANNDTLQIAINGGGTVTKTFTTGEFVAIGAATAEEVVASLNAFFASQGLACVASGTTNVTITGNRKGTGSIVNIVGGTGVGVGKLNFTTGALAGTGNVADVSAVASTELVTIMAGLTGGVASNVSGALKITTSVSGVLGSVQVIASSTADDELGFDNAVHAGSSGAAALTLTVDAKYDGAYADDVEIVIAAASDGDAAHFNLIEMQGGVQVRTWTSLSSDPASPRFVETIINDELTGSDLIAVTDAGINLPPAAGTFGPLAGGDDGVAGLVDNDWSGAESVNGATGLRTLDGTDFDVLICPGRATSAVHNAMVTYAEITREGLIFCVFDPPAGYTPAQIVTYVKTTAALKNLSEHAAIYWPRVKVSNPSKSIYGSDTLITVPPSGHIAGVMARLDASKVGGQFEQPAGTEAGLLRTVRDVEMRDVLKKAKRELIFPELINPITREGGGFFVDGARTLKSDGNWSSVGERRGVIFVEQTLIPGLAFMRHRNITDRLYREGQSTITLFLTNLTNAGCFKSTIPSEAFVVDLSPSLNPASVQAQNKVVARIGLATSEPAEFINLLIGPDTRALDAELAAAAA